MTMLLPKRENIETGSEILDLLLDFPSYNNNSHLARVSLRVESSD